MSTNLTTQDIQDLYISPRLLNNPQHELEVNKNKKEFNIDECKCKNSLCFKCIHFLIFENARNYKKRKSTKQ